MVMGAFVNRLPGPAEAASDSIAEAWVLQRVTAGQEADLKARFATEGDRVLTADFVKRLLTQPRSAARPPALGVVISDATVRGRLDLRNEDIAPDTRFLRCRFEDDVVLVQTRFQRTVKLDHTHFLKYADFRYLEIAGNLEALGAEFQDAQFERVRVGGDLLLHDAVFHGAATLDDVLVGGALRAPGAQFRARTSFRSMVVRGQARFGEAVFSGPVDFSYAEIGKFLELSRAQFPDSEAAVNFFSLKVAGNADFSGATFAGGLDLAKADVGGNLTLEDVVALNPREEKKLNGVKADVLIVSGAQFASPYGMSGMAYRFINSRSDQQLLALVGGANANGEALTSLETFYLRSGKTEAAKLAHITRRRSERAGLARSHPAGYVWNWGADLLTGYGQRLERALLWSVVVILVGCSVFWRRGWMETQRPGDADTYRSTYNPLWYSLAVFLPISGLDDGKIWAPKRDRWKTRIYQRLHTLLGYLLVPIGLAAWTGIIK